jgi:hypothetical protein
MKVYDNPELNMPVENTDYELVPSEGENWDVRILTGEFTETVLQYGKLVMSDDGEHLTFNFDVVASPDLELTDENLDLQTHAGKLLSSILENAVATKAPEDK